MSETDTTETHAAEGTEKYIPLPVVAHVTESFPCPGANPEKPIPPENRFPVMVTTFTDGSVQIACSYLKKPRRSDKTCFGYYCSGAPFTDHEWWRYIDYIYNKSNLTENEHERLLDEGFGLCPYVYSSRPKLLR